MDERLRILELIETREISVEEGARRLKALAEGTDPLATLAASVSRPALVRVVWRAVFWSGVVMMAGGGLLVAAVYAWEIAPGWQTCGWVLFTLGLLVLMIGWWLQRARWLSVRVRQSGPNVTLAFPLPLALVAWGLRIAQPFVPQLREMGMDELILALREEVRDGHPFAVEVDEGEDGEQVQIYFG
ncbi:MAG: hypothetical protein SWK90_10585 [Chloroflexota bacterium]|nr:hypothetical protein [Chloroflexota bacterium]